MTHNSKVHDLLVVGGGINGVGIAADAAGRGLDVLLCEQNDLASATSSASTKLIHGGLRYLEYYEFALVRKALAEREVLLRNAPHLIQPLRFVLPHRPHLRPRWMIRAGLFLYDSLSHRVSLPASRSVAFSSDSPLQDSLRNGFEYSDAWADDARLVVAIAQLAREHGAHIRVHRACTEAKEQDGVWHVTLRDPRTGDCEQVQARVLVNATGPWVARFAGQRLAARAHEPIRLVKGCHIVVPRLFHGDEAYMLQNDDGRIVFVIPYEQDFTLIGTTEEDVIGDPADARIAPWEVDYLVSVTNACFKAQISSTDVRHVFVGVRPLMAQEGVKASAVSRDYTLALDCDGAPLLTVYGGKITTYRTLAEEALHCLRPLFPEMGKDWTKQATLPGGDFGSRSALQQSLLTAFPWLPAPLAQRYVRSYGTRSWRLLEGCTSLASLGQDYGAGLRAREVAYLCEQEWASSAEDILWRRSKLGLHMTQAEQLALSRALPLPSPSARGI